MFIEIIAEAIREKSFIAKMEEEDDNENGESLVYSERVITAPRRNKPRQKSVNRSVIVAATNLSSVKTGDIFITTSLSD